MCVWIESIELGDECVSVHVYVRHIWMFKDKLWISMCVCGTVLNCQHIGEKETKREERK